MRKLFVYLIYVFALKFCETLPPDMMTGKFIRLSSVNIRNAHSLSPLLLFFLFHRSHCGNHTVFTNVHLRDKQNISFELLHRHDLQKWNLRPLFDLIANFKLLFVIIIYVIYSKQMIRFGGLNEKKNDLICWLLTATCCWLNWIFFWIWNLNRVLSYSQLIKIYKIKNNHRNAMKNII